MDMYLINTFYQSNSIFMVICTYPVCKTIVRHLVFFNFRYIVVYVYAVKNNETNDVKYLNIEKVFVTNGEFLHVLQLDQNNRPTVDIDG